MVLVVRGKVLMVVDGNEVVWEVSKAGLRCWKGSGRALMAVDDREESLRGQQS